jgi:signal transduction histidine kinase
MRFRARALEARTAELLAQAEAERAQLASAQAREIGRLQEDQARLARDVHDVVGHSLAVILAQAESAQFLADDPARLKETMATIATSARASLQDVRQVLASPEEQGAPRLGGLDALIDGVRKSGHLVESTEEGQRPPLPPDLDVVAHRVLQEMLTNAITHGRRDRPVVVERTWPSAGSPDLLRLRVRNTMGTPSDAAGGNGVPGMRRRLEAVGGRLDLRQDDDVFTATAWIPVRAAHTTGG